MPSQFYWGAAFSLAQDPAKPFYATLVAPSPITSKPAVTSLATKPIPFYKRFSESNRLVRDPPPYIFKYVLL